MYDHPDYLTMAQIVNGNDDLTGSLSSIEMDEYITGTLNLTASDIAGAAQDEAFTVISAAHERGIAVVGRTAWTVGFFFGMRLARDVTTDQIDMKRVFMDVDPESVNIMAVGRTEFMLTTSANEIMIAMSAWLDGAMTGIHFDKARI